MLVFEVNCVITVRFVAFIFRKNATLREDYQQQLNQPENKGELKSVTNQLIYDTP